MTSLGSCSHGRPTAVRVSARTRSSMPTTATGWQIVVYEASNGKCPALEYLSAASVPDQPRRELLLTVFAVAEMGPLNFPTGTTRWRLMHKPAKKGDVDMSGIFEARDQHNRRFVPTVLRPRSQPAEARPVDRAARRRHQAWADRDASARLSDNR